MEDTLVEPTMPTPAQPHAPEADFTRIPKAYPYMSPYWAARRAPRAPGGVPAYAAQSGLLRGDLDHLHSGGTIRVGT